MFIIGFQFDNLLFKIVKIVKNKQLSSEFLYKLIFNI